MTTNSMTASEFVSKAINDKAFLVEICRHIPDEMIAEENAEEAEKLPGGLGGLMAKYFWPGARPLGGDFDEAELQKECEEQINGLKGFKKGKFVVRFFRSLKKAGKTQKK